MTFLIILILGVGGYYWYQSNSKKKEAEKRKELLVYLSNEYDNAYKTGDISTMKSKARNLVNSPVAGQRILNLVYQQTLDLLKTNPDLKPFALEIGRIKYSKFRESGSPTVYDESAITNDINAAL